MNDAPVLTGAALTVTEGQTVALNSSAFTVADPDSSSFAFSVSNVSGGYFQQTAATGLDPLTLAD